MTKNNKGVTIVEILVYIGLLTIFMIVLVDVFTAILTAKLQSQSTSTLNQDARYILARITYDVENTLPSDVDITNPTTLSVGPDTFTLSGDKITLNNNGTGAVPLNGLDTKIDSLSFTKVGGTVQVIYTIESLVNLQSGVQTQTIQTTLGSRP